MKYIIAAFAFNLSHSAFLTGNNQKYRKTIEVICKVRKYCTGQEENIKCYYILGDYNSSFERGGLKDS